MMLNRAERESIIQSFLQAATAEDMDRVFMETQIIIRMMRDQPLLVDAMKDADTHTDKVEKLLKNILDAPSALTSAFLHQLARHGWLPLLGDMMSLAAQLRERSGRVRHVSVASAVPLTAAESKAIREALIRYWDAHIFLIESVQPALVGGLRLEADGWLYDASVRGRLDRVLAESIK